MDLIKILFGEGEHLNPLQMGCRMIVISLFSNGKMNKKNMDKWDSYWYTRM